MFEQAFKNIDDVLRKEAGCTTELDYTLSESFVYLQKQPHLIVDKIKTLQERTSSTGS
jgi:type I restriction enzyme M protein